MNIQELIKRRRLQLTVHSFIYYQLNQNIISDHTFDKWSKELVQLQQQYPEEAAQAPFAEEFKEFDGSSGYDLPYGNPEIQQIAFHLIAHHKKNQRT